MSMLLLGRGASSGVVSGWWRRFSDQPTEDLVELALANNTDIRVAAAGVMEARAALKRAAGARWPQVSGSLSTTRSKSSFVLPTTGRVGIWSTTYADDLSVSYQVDLFGRLARMKQAAWAEVLADEASHEAVRHTVVSQVVRGRVRVATIDRGLEVVRAIRSSWEATLGIVERRYLAGVAPALDLRLARENLASARAGEVELEGQLRIAGHALDVLVGRRPGEGLALPALSPELPELEPVPPDLPAGLLDRRPDLMQAEMRLAAATARIGVALADLYPSLNLTGSGGVRSDSLHELTSSSGLVYNLVGSIAGPLFSGGQRRADVRAARARAEQAAAMYSGAVLNALREVEDGLVADQTAQRRLELTKTRVAEARAADGIARDRYQRGVDPLLKVLDTERPSALGRGGLDRRSRRSVEQPNRPLSRPRRRLGAGSREAYRRPGRGRTAADRAGVRRVNGTWWQPSWRRELENGAVMRRAVIKFVSSCRGPRPRRARRAA